MSGEISSLTKTSLALLNELSLCSGKKAEFEFLEPNGVQYGMTFKVRVKLGEYEGTVHTLSLAALNNGLIAVCNYFSYW